jgi:glycosyltransferase involved in cell wall biosynthesis
MKVSAYVPCYNNDDTIEKTIESIRLQSKKVNEIFVIDDGSTDNSVKKCKNQDVKVICNAVNMGRGYTRHRAMKIAKNDLVLSCDATLTLPNDFIVNALKWFYNEKSLAAVYGLVTQKQAFTAADRWRNVHLFKANINHELIRQFGFISGGSLVNKNAVLMVDNYNKNLNYGEDGDLGLRLINNGFTTIFDPKLRLNSNKSDTYFSVLERYWRWNQEKGKPFSLKNYFKNILYSWKVMLKNDINDKDIDRMMISIICPHYQLMKSIFSKKNDK